MEAESKKIEWIAFLRGFAALLVFFSHLPLYIPANIMFVIGRVGVVIFFLMSGYLTVSARNKRSRLKYIFNRLTRIYPMYWIILALMCIAVGTANLPQILANLTLFQEFLGCENIIGASWMLPIQVTFFVGVCIFGIGFFTGKDEKNRQRYIILILVMLFSNILAVLRFATEMPFPTAFFLLIAVAVLGINIKDLEQRSEQKTKIILIAIFEAGLVPAVVFSYHEVIEYILAYNLGLALFLLAKRFNFKSKIMTHLGEIGFAFFLGAHIPILFIKRFVTFAQTPLMSVVESIIIFVTAYILALILTLFVEKPLLKLFKKIENKK